MKDIVKKNKGIMLTGAAVVLSIAVVVASGLLASCSSAGAADGVGIGDAAECIGESALEGIELPNVAESAKYDEANKGSEADAATGEEPDDTVEHVEAYASGGASTQPPRLLQVGAQSRNKRKPLQASLPLPKRNGSRSTIKYGSRTAQLGRSRCRSIRPRRSLSATYAVQTLRAMPRRMERRTCSQARGRDTTAR